MTVAWNGDAPAVAQVATGSIDSLDGTPGANIFIVTIDDVEILQVGTADVATTAAALVVLLNASTDARFSVITWDNPSAGTITGTADSPGVPFIVTLTETGAGTGSVTNFTNSTENSGPNDFDTDANWSAGAVPVDTDDVVVANSAVSILYGLDQVDLELASFTVRDTFTGHIGLPRTNSAGNIEYLRRYLKLTATVATIDSRGSGRIYLEFDTDSKTAITVNGSGTSATAGLPSILLIGGHTTNTLSINRGDVGVALETGQTAFLASVDMAYISRQSTDANLTCGAGVVFTASTTLTKNGGVATIRSNIATISQTAGTVAVEGSAAITTLLDIVSGTCFYKSSGTITLVDVAGVLDFRHDSQSRVVTTINAYKGSAIHDPSKTVDWSANGINLVKTDPTQVVLNCGNNLTWTPTAI